MRRQLELSFPWVGFRSAGSFTESYSARTAGFGPPRRVALVNGGSGPPGDGATARVRQAVAGSQLRTLIILGS